MDSSGLCESILKVGILLSNKQINKVSGKINISFSDYSNCNPEAEGNV